MMWPPDEATMEAWARSKAEEEVMSDEWMSEERRKEFESDCRRSIRDKEWPKHCRGYVPVSMVWECFEEIDRLKAQLASLQARYDELHDQRHEEARKADENRAQIVALERERDGLREALTAAMLPYSARNAERLNVAIEKLDALHSSEKAP